MNYYDFQTIKYNPYTSIIITPNKDFHSCSFWTITYAIRGECTQITNNVERIIDTSTILIIKPNEPHQVPRYSNDFIQRDIYISDYLMQKICSFLPYNIYDTILNDSAFFQVPRIQLESLELILNSFPVNKSQRDSVLSTLHVAAIINILALFVDFKNKQSQPPQWLKNLVNSVSSKNITSLSISDLLKDVHYSHGYICRQFKKYYGCSLYSYINKKKIISSVSLLTNKNNSIADVAYELGFATENAYIKAFKAHFNITPGKWRKLNLDSKDFIVSNIWGDFSKL